MPTLMTYQYFFILSQGTLAPYAIWGNGFPLLSEFYLTSFYGLNGYGRGYLVETF